MVDFPNLRIGGWNHGVTFCDDSQSSQYEVSDRWCAECGEPILYKVSGQSRSLMGVTIGMEFASGRLVNKGAAYHFRCQPAESQ